MRAAVNYLKNGGKKVIITSPQYMRDALTHGKGTHIIRDIKSGSGA